MTNEYYPHGPRPLDSASNPVDSFSVGMTDIICNVRCDIALQKTWNHYLAPYFVLDSTSPHPGARFTLRQYAKSDIEDRLWRATFQSNVLLHGEMAGRIGRRLDTGHLLVQNLQLESLYEIAPDPIPSVELLYPGPFDSDALDSLRIVRGWVVRSMEMRGASRCHMSALARGGKAIAFIGDQGAGKTSFMLSLLRTQRGYEFIANDKALIGAGGNGRTVHPAIWGLPLAVAISTASLPSCPEIAPTRDSRIIDGKLYLWPQDLAQDLNTSCTPKAELAVVCFCHLDLRKAGITTSAIPPENRPPLEHSPLLQFTDRINPDWLLEILHMPTPKPTTAGLLLNVPWIQLEGNPWYEGWPQLADKLLLT